ncbi:hypothetical protein EJ06DRAFT_527630 [Trichodelitschia bisporula]|uniref:Uncharacterized protein n=1 Tax=Trichodelitschia bisporula TaxID=703511 RepID=A0A6G1I6Y3_9PEZI|nr:hypothetical protein EJ06DRAFT_527630 [Trichodelitschia bisporula]
MARRRIPPIDHLRPRITVRLPLLGSPLQKDWHNPKAVDSLLSRDRWSDGKGKRLVEILPIAEFEANASVSATTGFAPFEATKGYVPCWGIEPPEPGDQDLTFKDKLSRQQVDRIISRIIKVRETLKHQMAWAQAVQKEYADRHRIPAPEFRVGDMVSSGAPAPRGSPGFGPRRGRARPVGSARGGSRVGS